MGGWGSWGRRGVLRAWGGRLLRAEPWWGAPGWEMEAAGQGGSCYQLSFQQDAFEGREERLVHGEALEPRSCPLFRGSVPAIPSTEHLHGAHRAQPPLPPARKENGKLTGWGSRERSRKALRET